jgi:D-alanyl-D-alanine carboxypeptidase
VAARQVVALALYFKDPEGITYEMQPTSHRGGRFIGRSGCHGNSVDRYQQQLDDWREQAAVPVAAAAVRVNGDLVWHGVSHAANVDGADLMSPRSRFPVYSITKTFTAVCVLRLAQAGLLDVHDSVDKWMDDLVVPRTLLLSHLLQHTGGVPDYGPLAKYHEAVRRNPSRPWTDQEFFNTTLGNGLLFEPGTGWAYSNIGYLILRRVIERAAGVSFRLCIDEHIVSRLGLNDTSVAEVIQDWECCVPGWGREVRTDAAIVDVRSTYHPGWCAPGVAVSTVDDVTEVYDGLFRGELLDSEHLNLMLQVVRVPGSHPPAVTPSCGMGVLADPDGPFGPSYGHGGGGPGYSLEASILPGSPVGRLSVAVFCNSSLVVDVQVAVHALLQVATPAT